MPARTGPPRVLVIGSGVAGLAAACRLASRGVQVLLMERRAELGGRTTLLRHESKQSSWSWDWESAPLHKRELLESFWSKLGRDFSADIRLQRLPDPRCFWLDGSEQTLDENFWQQAALQPLHKKTQALSAQLRKLSEATKAPSVLHALQNHLQVKLGQSISAEIQKLSQPKLRQILLALASPETSHPSLTPANLLLQGFKEYAQAPWPRSRIEGGNAQLTSQLLKLAQELQVETRPRCEVRHIFPGEHSRWRVEYCKLGPDSSHQLDCDGLVCAMDVSQNLHQLFTPPQAAQIPPSSAPKTQLSLSGFTLCLALNKPIPSLSAQNFFLGNPSKQSSSYDRLFFEGSLPANPRLEVLLNSRLEPSWAPSSGESLQLRTPAPLIGPQIAWSSRARSYAESLLRQLQEDYGLLELEQSPAHLAMRTPSDYEGQFQLPLGSLAGYARHGRHAWRRPANQRRKYKQVSFAGASTHPGPSIAQCVHSGNLAAESLLQQFQLPL